MDTAPTPSQTVGPFFHVNLTTVENCVRCIAGPQAEGERLWLSCRVLDGAGQPVSDAMIEIWQADADGRYGSADGHDGATVVSKDEPCWRGFGRMPTGQDGSCEFETIRPGRVAGPGGVPQAPHLQMAIFARGMLKQLFTRIYFADDPANREDAVLQLVPEDRRETLMAHCDSARPEKWRFHVHLQGEQETVFFDV
jgi:protocatechuate 3,4-dioxygenase, alpha subunit